MFKTLPMKTSSTFWPAIIGIMVLLAMAAVTAYRKDSALAPVFLSLATLLMLLIAFGVYFKSVTMIRSCAATVCAIVYFIGITSAEGIENTGIFWGYFIQLILYHILSSKAALALGLGLLFSTYGFLLLAAGSDIATQYYTELFLDRAFGIMLLMALIYYFHARQIESMTARLAHEAYSDPLTGLANRRSVDQLFGDAERRTKERVDEVGILLIDVDQFKGINDTFGHACGDQVLTRIGTEFIAARLRTSDVAARWGGEEFLVILKDTSLDAAIGVAEKLRLDIAAREFQHGAEFFKVSVSIGVTAGRLSERRLEDLIKIADHYLYDAKCTGRNKTMGGEL